MAKSKVLDYNTGEAADYVRAAKGFVIDRPKANQLIDGWLETGEVEEHEPVYDTDGSIVGPLRPIDRADVDRALGRKHPGGRPREIDWEAFWLEMCVHLHHEGMPATNEELVERMTQWFIDRHDNHPAPSEIRKRVSKLRERLNDSEN